MPLELDEVQRVAWNSSELWEELHHDDKAAVVSFARKGARIDVYYATGTVATELVHPKREKPTKLFRENVDIQVLAELFENPRYHTGKGYYDEKGKQRLLKLQRTKAVSEVPKDEYAALEAQVARIDEEVGRVNAVRERLVRRMQVLSSTREPNSRVAVERIVEKSCNGQLRDPPQAAVREKPLDSAEMEANKPLADEDATFCGREVSFFMNDKLWDFLKPIEPLSTELAVGNASGPSDLDGHSLHHGTLPSHVEEALKSCKQCRIVSLTLGMNGLFYVQLSNGSYVHSPQRKLDDALLKGNGKVRMVTFGQRADSFLVLYNDGRFVCNDIPSRLVDALNSCKSQVVFVRLGKDGQYFARFADGFWIMEGLDNDKQRFLDDVDGKLHEVTIGSPSTVIRND